MLILLLLTCCIIATAQNDIIDLNQLNFTSKHAYSAAYGKAGSHEIERRIQLTPISHKGENAFLYSVSIIGKNTVTDIKVFNTSFEPISRAILAEYLLKRLETVVKNDVTGLTIFPNDSIEKLTFKKNGNATHAGMPELILSVMELSQHKKFKIKNFSSDLLSYPKWVNSYTKFIVENKDIIKFNSRSFKVVKVKASFTGLDGQNLPLPEITYWISKSTPYLIQFAIGQNVYRLLEYYGE